jgi:hypothetical protein
MRKFLRTVIVAAVVAAPFTLGASPANAAECTPDGPPVQLCGEGMGNININIPGIIRVCIRIANPGCP